MNMTLYYFAFDISILNTVLHYCKQIHTKRLEIPEAVYRLGDTRSRISTNDRQRNSQNSTRQKDKGGSQNETTHKTKD